MEYSREWRVVKLRRAVFLRGEANEDRLSGSWEGNTAGFEGNRESDGHRGGSFTKKRGGCCLAASEGVI